MARAAVAASRDRSPHGVVTATTTKGRAATVIVYAITAWLAEISPFPLTLAVVAAMVTQTSLVLRPKREMPAPVVPPTGPEH